MNIQLLRHATLVVEYGGQRILVDQMLSHAEAMEPVANASVVRRIPMVELPLGDSALFELLDQFNLVVVTHTHRDHWDSRAIELLHKDVPLLCQPSDINRLRADGFVNLYPVEESSIWQNLQITRTGGQHGTGEIGKKMGSVSGFVFSAAGEPSLYIAGDTIWCPEVKDALQTLKPAVTVVNAGGAQYLVGDPITMSAEDVVQVCRALPETRVAAVHMGAVNHCLVTREALRTHLQVTDLADRVSIPEDGETITFAR